MANKPISIHIFPDKIPGIFKEFIDLACGNTTKHKFSKKHKFYPAIEFYFENKEKNWAHLEVPKFVRDAINEIGTFVLLKSLLIRYSKGKPIKALLRVNAIETLSTEAMIASNYLRREYGVQWPSIFGKDPPDLVIYDHCEKIEVDIEVKVKERKGSVETMFDSLSRGLQSLKKRGSKGHKRAVIAIHNSDDLNWKEWLEAPEVIKRLTSRLKNDEYKIVSGIIFSGGVITNKEKYGAEQYHTKFAAFRSNAATYQLPKGFLTNSGEI